MSQTMKAITGLLMLVACAPSTRAQDLVLRAIAVETRAENAIVPMGRFTVTPSPEDQPARVKGRWQRFEEALNASPLHGAHRIVETIANDGTRVVCHEPCLIGCCVRSGGFAIATPGFGR